MSSLSTDDDKIAVLIEQYENRAEARVPGWDADGKLVAATAEAVVEMLLERWRSCAPIATRKGLVAISLLTIPPGASDLRPPMVVYAPEGVLALFEGHLKPIQPPPLDAIWIKPGEQIPENAGEQDVFVIPHRQTLFNRDLVVIRSNHGSHRLLHHSGGGVRLSPAQYTTATVSRKTQSFSNRHPLRADKTPSREPDPVIAVVIEQYRDHAEAYLPGMGPGWHTNDVTPDGALEFLAQLIGRYRPIVPVPGLVAVSLVTMNLNAVGLHPATVERAPTGVLVLFSGHLMSGEVPNTLVHRLEPGELVPADAPPGTVFLQPPLTEGWEDEGQIPHEAVVIRAQPGQDHRVLAHAGPVVLQIPELLVRVQHGRWGEPRHEVSPVK